MVSVIRVTRFSDIFGSVKTGSQLETMIIVGLGDVEVGLLV